MFATPPSRMLSRTPARDITRLEGVEPPATSAIRRAEHLSKSRGSQNHKSATINGLITSIDEATKLDAPLVASLPSTPPPAGLPPRVPNGRAYPPTRKASKGTLPVRPRPSLPPTMLPADSMQEPRRAPLPPKRPPRPQSELFLPLVPGAIPVFQDDFLERAQGKAKQSGVASVEVDGKSTHISTRYLPRTTPKGASSTPVGLRILPEQMTTEIGLHNSAWTAAGRTALELRQRDPLPTIASRGSRAPLCTDLINYVDLSQPIEDSKNGAMSSDAISQADGLSEMSTRSPTTNGLRTASSSPLLHSTTHTPVRAIRRPDRAINPDRLYSTKVRSMHVKRREDMHEGFDLNNCPLEGPPHSVARPKQKHSGGVEISSIPSHPAIDNETPYPSQGDSSVSPTTVFQDSLKQLESATRIARACSTQQSQSSSYTGRCLAQLNKRRAEGREFGHTHTRNLARIHEDAETSKGDVEPATSVGQYSGSAVTVVAPELVAWRPAAYLQGPIKLLKPGIVPRKNSVAMLEPFQEAVDQMYQHASVISRRNSEDAAEREICDFFDHFGFDYVGLEDDNLDDKLRRVDRDDDLGTPRVFKQSVASPMEKRVAEESIVCVMSPRSSPGFPTRKPAYPDANLGKTAQAWQTSDNWATSTPNARKESLTLGGRGGSIAELLSPSPENGILRSSRLSSQLDVAGESQSIAGPTGSSGFDWDDDVSEMEAASTWVAPTATLPKRHPLSKDVSRARTRNPVAKLRRLVATASAIL